MYALDWQHQCYSFNPFLPFEKIWSSGIEMGNPALSKWRSLHFFLTKDFKNGIFGDGIHHDHQYLFLVKKW